MKGVRVALYGLATILSVARALLPFLLTTYVSFKVRRYFLLRKLVKIMEEGGVSEEHARLLAESLVPDPVKLLREVVF